MSSADKPRSGTDERRRRKVQLARMEADLAYFQARIEILREPTSANQEAQRRAFRLLHDAIGGEILRVRQRLAAER